MPTSYDDYDDDFDYGGLSEDHQREFLYELIGFTERELDQEARSLFWDVMYNNELSLGQRLELYEQLNDHIRTEYGIEFDDVWDWEAFRSWYDAQMV
jgi:hypothetical protein